MSSKRGRKRNDNLPPNRARDVQRAFRARRAAHLQALEERVTELEEENDHLRAALNLPPASRPPLGRGPTGKDKMKAHDRSSMVKTESVIGEGSASPRTNNSSPHSVGQPIPSTSQVGNAGGSSGGMWEDVMSMSQHDDYGSERDVHSSMAPNIPAASTSYTSETPPQFRFEPPGSSRSRSSLSGALFSSPGPSGYQQSTDRSANSASNYSRESESFYSMATVSSGGRNLSQSSPGLHPHSIPHHMGPSMGGGAHSPMGSHASFSSASQASPPVSLSMAMGLRRSIHDPQHVSSYVDPYPPGSYPQRTQSGNAHQSHNNVHTLSAGSRLPPSHTGVSRPGFAGPELSPTGEPSFRRTT